MRLIIQAAPSHERNRITFIIESEDIDLVKGLIPGWKKAKTAGRVEIDTDVAKIAIVGWRIASTPGLGARMFTALADRGINIDCISTSEMKVSCIIAEKAWTTRRAPSTPSSSARERCLPARRRATARRRRARRRRAPGADKRVRARRAQVTRVRTKGQGTPQRPTPKVPASEPARLEVGNWECLGPWCLALGSSACATALAAYFAFFTLGGGLSEYEFRAQTLTLGRVTLTSILRLLLRRVRVARVVAEDVVVAASRRRSASAPCRSRSG